MRMNTNMLLHYAVVITSSAADNFFMWLFGHRKNYNYNYNCFFLCSTFAAAHKWNHFHFRWTFSIILQQKSPFNNIFFFLFHCWRSFWLRYVRYGIQHPTNQYSTYHVSNIRIKTCVCFDRQCDRWSMLWSCWICFSWKRILLSTGVKFKHFEWPSTVESGETQPENSMAWLGSWHRSFAVRSIQILNGSYNNNKSKSFQWT